MNINPRNVGLPHDIWRPSQLDAYKKTLQLHETTGGVIAMELPTGCGKSGVATALGAHDHILVLVQNLGLLEQYERVYGFAIIKGKPEYDCVLPEKVFNWRTKYNKVPTAGDCHYPQMGDCPMAYKCPYLIAKRKAIESKRTACTYRYASLSKHMQDRKGIIVFDECHLSGNEILALSSIDIDSNLVEDFGFSKLDELHTRMKNNSVMTDVEKEIAISWIESNMSRLGTLDMFDMLSIEGARAKKVKELLDKAKSLLESQMEVFYRYGERQSYATFKHPIMQVSFKPIEASTVVKEIISNKKTLLLMSATIGNPKPLARELGIETFEKIEYGHPTPTDKRPIYDLELMPMTRANIEEYPSLLKMQAIKISKFIQSLDPAWRGIVLTTSNYKIQRLKELVSDDIKARIFRPSRTALGVNDRVSEFISDRSKGIIAFETIQGWGSGIDLRDDTGRFAVIAGVEFPNPSDPYDVARTKRPGGWLYGMWNAYNGVVQASGRVSRGEIDKNGDYLLNTVALADGSATSKNALNYYPQWFKEAIIR